MKRQVEGIVEFFLILELLKTLLSDHIVCLPATYHQVHLEIAQMKVVSTDKPGARVENDLLK